MHVYLYPSALYNINAFTKLKCCPCTEYRTYILSLVAFTALPSDTVYPFNTQECVETTIVI